MNRQKLTDGTNRWFDIEKSEKFKENTYWNGHNWISKSTGSQWHHEELFRTASGKWILWSYSNWQGETDKVEELTNQQTAEWFVKNEYSDEDIPNFKSLKKEIESLEI